MHKFEFSVCIAVTQLDKAQLQWNQMSLFVLSQCGPAQINNYKVGGEFPYLGIHSCLPAMDA